ncbi:FMN reductase (NADPH) [Alcaligenes pakistanensis]|uniref:FMN reductase (NADPH) n=1 Tax=Alcaligenes pakistanensis TaxID=1482717 RepID=A0A8H9M1N9_9BURK|nr:FMN reductase [Alcaligenes pakistanensis]MBP6620943.1 FMN reductase [Alcaligenes sp.]GHC57115.1 FMN reductase (NADPH) [Alcaligenes pakistanensis]HCA16025.1 FMN reductase [Alcaligenes faecalis]
MSRPLKTVIVNGSLHRPSRTQVLLDALRDTLNDQLALDVQNIELVSLLPELGAALSTDALPAHAHQAIRAIEQADFLIVGSPIFRAGIPGLLKHLFDLVDMNALNGTPVLLAATGGSQRHALVIEHQLRPLFSFFQALTLPIGVYATPEDIQDGEISSTALQQHLQRSVDLAIPILQGVQARLPQRATLLEAQAA